MPVEKSVQCLAISECLTKVARNFKNSIFHCLAQGEIDIDRIREVEYPLSLESKVFLLCVRNKAVATIIACASSHQSRDQFLATRDNALEILEHVTPIIENGVTLCEHHKISSIWVEYALSSDVKSKPLIEAIEVMDALFAHAHCNCSRDPCSNKLEPGHFDYQADLASYDALRRQPTEQSLKMFAIIAKLCPVFSHDEFCALLHAKEQQTLNQMSTLKSCVGGNHVSTLVKWNPRVECGFDVAKEEHKEEPDAAAGVGESALAKKYNQQAVKRLERVLLDQRRTLAALKHKVVQSKKRQRDAEDERAVAHAKRLKVDERLVIMSQKNERQLGIIREANKKAENWCSKFKEIQQQFRHAKGQIVILEEEIARLNAAGVALEEHVTVLNDQIASGNEQLNTFIQREKENESSFDDLLSENDDLIKENKEVNSKLACSNRELDAKVIELDEARQELLECKSSLEAKTSDFTAGWKQYWELQSELERVQSEKDNAQALCDQVILEKGKLETHGRARIFQLSTELDLAKSGEKKALLAFQSLSTSNQLTAREASRNSTSRAVLETTRQENARLKEEQKRASAEMKDLYDVNARLMERVSILKREAIDASLLVAENESLKDEIKRNQQEHTQPDLGALIDRLNLDQHAESISRRVAGEVAKQLNGKAVPMKNSTAKPTNGASRTRWSFFGNSRVNMPSKRQRSSSSSQAGNKRNKREKGGYRPSTVMSALARQRDQRVN